MWVLTWEVQFVLKFYSCSPFLYAIYAGWLVPGQFFIAPLLDAIVLYKDRGGWKGRRRAEEEGYITLEYSSTVGN